MNPFTPHELPIDFQLDIPKLMRPSLEAMQKLASYNGLLQGLVNPRVLLSPMIVQEAVLSSRIEGTVATMAEVLRFEAGQKYEPEKVNDIEEIRNYRNALSLASQEIHNRSISLSMVKTLHGILMQGVRGKDKNPGQFRDDQNWIGSRDCSIEEASYVPPSPLVLIEHLDKWVNYLNLDADNALLQTAVMFAQFEVLHPFKDGNGRIGRLLIPLFLCQKNILNSPTFYLSAYLERHREENNARLRAISDKDDWQGWIEFFLRALIAQAEENANKAKRILELYETLKAPFQQTTRSQYALSSLDSFFAAPILNATQFKERAGIEKRATSNAILRQLEDNELIQRLSSGSGQQPAVFCLPQLLAITE